MCTSEKTDTSRIAATKTSAAALAPSIIVREGFLARTIIERSEPRSAKSFTSICLEG